jgi:lipopolysaccharide transport system ATP-binding protein
MSDPVIQVDRISKRYLIGLQAAKGDGLRHAIEAAVRSPARWLRDRRQRHQKVEEFWALRDVSFSVEQGEVVGIIGRNGAGKSTLLKLLSRITEPTTGRIRLRGRMASLLEVGTGFHPELTGRENIFLNGAILGMRRAEIKRKLDEIIAFSEIEKFLDTPVKRYSSGMYVRLAFAVAAHLEPEILVVDEVLAVGDAEFQKKCLRKMGDVANAGRTVLFVSHNMQAVTRLCSRCILLHRGEVKLDGESNRVANAYLNSGLTTSSVREWDRGAAPGDSVARLYGVRIRSEQGEVVEAIDIRKPIVVELEYEVFDSEHHLLPHFALRNQDGTVLFVAVDMDPAWRGRRRPAGRYVSAGTIPGNLLAEGMLSVSATLMSLNPNHVHAKSDDAVAFRVLDDMAAPNTARGDYAHPMPGVLRPLLQWRTRRVDPSVDAIEIGTPLNGLAATGTGR